LRNFLILAAAVFLIAITVTVAYRPACACAPMVVTRVAEMAETARMKHHLPGVAVLVRQNGVNVASFASGVRANGHPEPVTMDDRWHIGSDTKSFTSTLIMILAEKGVLRIDETLAEALPALAPKMNAAYRTVTIKQLLSHTAGLPTLTDDKDLPAFMAAISQSPDEVRQRQAAAEHYLAMPPASAMGEFAYSNLGYIFAGAIAEAKTGKTWEELVQTHIFAPLGITHAGFGLPGTPNSFDQPHGHKETATGLVALDPSDPAGDNPRAIGPAGLINITLGDWMLFAQDQLDGVHGRGKLLKPESYRLLHTPVVGPYALGWGVKPGPDGVPLVITHSGSNGYWIADVRIYPKKDLIVLFAANAGNEEANNAVQTFGAAIKDYFKPFD
jgi:CubicO group peptidase (beta-lactamase class C family)